MIISIFNGMLEVFLDVLLALAPILLIFVISHFWFLKYSKKRIKTIIIGIVFTLLGLMIFLQGVQFGFLPLAQSMGEKLGGLEFKWIIIPIGFLIGLSTTLADPAIYVLVKEVEETSGGAIKRRVMFISLCIGVGLAISLAMVKLLVDIPIYYIIIPGYIIAITLTYFVEPDFSAMAFDSGGVVTGTMVASFLLPLSTGVAKSLGGDPLIDGFGIVGLVALTPIITMLTLGLIMKRAKNKVSNNILKEKSNDNKPIVSETQEVVDKQNNLMNK